MGSTGERSSRELCLGGGVLEGPLRPPLEMLGRQLSKLGAWEEVGFRLQMGAISCLYLMPGTGTSFVQQSVMSWQFRAQRIGEGMGVIMSIAARPREADSPACLLAPKASQPKTLFSFPSTCLAVMRGMNHLLHFLLCWIGNYTTL